MNKNKKIPMEAAEIGDAFARLPEPPLQTFDAVFFTWRRIPASDPNMSLKHCVGFLRLSWLWLIANGHSDVAIVREFLNVQAKYENPEQNDALWQSVGQDFLRPTEVGFIDALSELRRFSNVYYDSWETLLDALRTYFCENGYFAPGAEFPEPPIPVPNPFVDRAVQFALNGINLENPREAQPVEEEPIDEVEFAKLLREPLEKIVQSGDGLGWRELVNQLGRLNPENLNPMIRQRLLKAPKPRAIVASRRPFLR